MPCILSLYGLTFVLPRSISMQKQPTSLSLLRNSAQISLWGFGRRILSFIRLNSIWQENHSLRISVGGYGRISYHCCPARLSRGRYRITFRANRNRIFCPPPFRRRCSKADELTHGRLLDLRSGTKLRESSVEAEIRWAAHGRRQRTLK
jgi:hypothetical protein